MVLWRQLFVRQALPGRAGRCRAGAAGLSREQAEVDVTAMRLLRDQLRPGRADWRTSRVHTGSIGPAPPPTRAARPSDHCHFAEIYCSILPPSLRSFVCLRRALARRRIKLMSVVVVVVVVVVGGPRCSGWSWPSSSS